MSTTQPNAPAFNFMLLYVADPAASTAFYAKLLGLRVIEQSPSFSMLSLREGVMLGLWKKEGVEPANTSQPGAGEIAFVVADAAAVADTCAQWAAKGATIAQKPTVMDFGTTFTALDPDGHRLRVFVPG